MTRTEVDVKRTRHSRQYRALEKFSKISLKYIVAVHRMDKEEWEARRLVNAIYIAII